MITDLHYYLKQNDIDPSKWIYLMAIIDDRTRFLLHIEMIREKTMKATSEVLLRCLSKWKKPHTIVVDNGLEFVGEDFAKIIRERDIIMHRIHVKKPHENGKIERFWRTIESSIIDRMDLAAFEKEYNEYWVHSALKDLTGRKMTPREAWMEMEHYSSQDDPAVIYT